MPEPKVEGATKSLTPVLIFSFFAFMLLFWLLYGNRNHSASTWGQFLPTVNASLNGLSTVLLLLAFNAIKKKKIELHRRFMTTALITSSLFLICYLLYHYVQGDTKFQGEGFVRFIYLSILLTHIALSMVGFPLILWTFLLGRGGRVQTHRRVAKWTFPIWLYVSVTGLIIYFFLYSSRISS